MTLREYLQVEPKLQDLIKSSITMSYQSFKQDAPKFTIPGLYIIVNKTKGTAYVGKSINIYKRIMSHKQSTMKSAIMRKDDLVIKIIPTCINSEEWRLESFLVWYYALRFTSCNRQSIACMERPQFNRKPEDWDA